jgi:serine protease inhibitor
MANAPKVNSKIPDYAKTGKNVPGYFRDFLRAIDDGVITAKELETKIEPHYRDMWADDFYRRVVEQFAAQQYVRFDSKDTRDRILEITSYESVEPQKPPEGGVHSTEKVGDVAPTRVDPRIAQAVNTFGFRLQSVLSKKGESSVVSGASVAILLAMMTNGAKENEVGALISGLGLEGMSVKEINAGFKTLAAHLSKGADGVEYSIANSVWGDEAKFPLDPGFVDRVKKEFGADAKTTELAQASEEINGWVENATKGMIKDFVTPDLLADCYFAAMNAIYFKGTWKTEFDPKKTVSGFPFAKADGSEADVDMMIGDDVVGKAKQSADYQAAKLPFGKDGASSLVVWVPKTGDTSDLVNKLGTPEGQKELLSGFYDSSGAVYLPRFETETESDILKAFEALGIKGAGPFSAAGSGTASFDVIKQKAKLVVNEAGAEAAAVTGGFGLESIPMPMLQADRPFAYAIIDEATQLVSFSGTFEGN